MLPRCTSLHTQIAQLSPHLHLRRMHMCMYACAKHAIPPSLPPSLPARMQPTRRGFMQYAGLLGAAGAGVVAGYLLGSNSAAGPGISAADKRETGELPEPEPP